MNRYLVLLFLVGSWSCDNVRTAKPDSAPPPAIWFENTCVVDQQCNAANKVNCADADSVAFASMQGESGGSFDNGAITCSWHRGFMGANEVCAFKVVFTKNLAGCYEETFRTFAPCGDS